MPIQGEQTHPQASRRSRPGRNREVRLWIDQRTMSLSTVHRSISPLRLRLTHLNQTVSPTGPAIERGPKKHWRHRQFPRLSCQTGISTGAHDSLQPEVLGAPRVIHELSTSYPRTQHQARRKQVTTPNARVSWAGPDRTGEGGAHPVHPLLLRLPVGCMTWRRQISGHRS